MPVKQYLEVLLLLLVVAAAVNDLATRRIPSVPELRVTASFGVAEYAGETNTEQLVAAADDALYRAPAPRLAAGERPPYDADAT